jgi:MFS family permease
MSGPSPEAEPAPGLRALLLPMAVVIAPQTTLAAVQHSLSVLGPEITRAGGLPPEGVGLIGGLVHAGAVWFFAASGAVMGPLGPVRALTAACVLSAAAATAILTGFAPLMLLAAPLIGFAYAATAPAGSEILAAATPKRLWGALFSIRMAGVPAGGALAGVVAAGLAATVSWRAGLAAMAALPLVCALFLLAAGGPWRSAGRAWPRLAAVLSPGNLATPFRLLRRTPQLRALTVASLGFAAAQSAAFTFLTTYLTQSVGLTLALAGALFATMQGASFVGRIAVGLAADRLGARGAVLSALGVLSALATASMTLAAPDTPAPLLFLGAAFAGVSIATWNGLFLAEIAAVARADEVSTATSAATFFTFLGYMAAPLAFATVASLFGYREAYLITSLCVLASAAGLRLAR